VRDDDDLDPRGKLSVWIVESRRTGADPSSGALDRDVIATHIAGGDTTESEDGYVLVTERTICGLATAEMKMVGTPSRKYRRRVTA
jgi:hypothetical protein